MRILLAAFLLLSATDAFAQAWPQPYRGLYAKLSYGRSDADEQFNSDGNARAYSDGVADGAFEDRSGYLYAEYGLTKSLTLVGLLPFKTLTTRDLDFRYQSRAAGSAQIGARYGLADLLRLTGTRHTAAIAGLLTVPLGYERNRTPAVGTGQVDVQASLHYGLSLFPLPLYAQLGGGYRARSDVYAFSSTFDCVPGRSIGCVVDATPDYGDEWFYNAEVGASDGRWVLLQALVQGVSSTQTIEPERITADGGLPTRQRFFKVGGGLTVYPVASVGISVQAFRTPSGANTIRSTDVFVGLEYIRR